MTLRCRGCGEALGVPFLDLGLTPLANSYVPFDRVQVDEPRHRLAVVVCERCWLVQLDHVVDPGEIFDDYAYFSSWSSSWVAHAQRFADAMISSRRLGGSSMVVELASNDGYLLRSFVEREVPVLGIEPAGNVAAVAESRGVPTRREFFGVELARQLVGEGVRPDLIVANNVLAHVPDLHDFVAGMAVLLPAGGLITIEFPHVLRLIERLEFDTIYHEHFSYLSLLSIEPVLNRHGLAVVDVEELATHGGSLRLHVVHVEEADAVLGGNAMARSRVDELRNEEADRCLGERATYDEFGRAAAERARSIKAVVCELIGQGCTIGGYGAPAKAATLLNYCGIGPELLPFTVDANPEKQQRFMPGCRVPIYGPDELDARRPDIVWLLPWNLRDELVDQLAPIRAWGGRFLVTHPEIQVF